MFDLHCTLTLSTRKHYSGRHVRVHVAISTCTGDYRHGCGRVLPMPSGRFEVGANRVIWRKARSAPSWYAWFECE